MTVDGNGNRITASPAGASGGGFPLVIVRLADDPTTGYIALDEGTGGFGDEECPSSHGMPCQAWFGPGERYATPEAALAAISEGGEEKDVARMEAEAGCELAELSQPTLRERAQRLLDCEDPPRGADAALASKVAS